MSCFIGTCGTFATFEKPWSRPPLRVSNLSFLWKVFHGLIWGVVKSSLWWPHPTWLKLLEQQKGKCSESQQRYRFGLRKRCSWVLRTLPRKVRTSGCFDIWFWGTLEVSSCIRGICFESFKRGKCWNMKAVVDMNTVLRNRWCSVPHRCFVKVFRCRNKELYWKFRVNKNHQNALHLHSHKKQLPIPKLVP